MNKRKGIIALIALYCLLSCASAPSSLGIIMAPGYPHYAPMSPAPLTEGVGAPRQYTVTIQFTCDPMTGSTLSNLNVIYQINKTTSSAQSLGSCACTTPPTVCTGTFQIDVPPKTAGTSGYFLIAGNKNLGTEAWYHSDSFVIASANPIIIPSLDPCGNLTSTDALGKPIRSYGVHCWQYGETHKLSLGVPLGWDFSNFTCTGFPAVAITASDAYVQINPGKPCLVKCEHPNAFGVTLPICTCSLVSPCVDDCFESIIFPRCGTVDNFSCRAPDYSCADGTTPNGIQCSETSECRGNCARECGRATTCPAGGMKDCQECCAKTTCNKLNPAYSDPELEGCMGTCRSICESNMQMCNVVITLLSLVAGAAAVMLTVNGVLWMTTDEPETRKGAKNSVVYVLIGVAVALVATALVSAIYQVPLFNCY